MSNKTAKKKAKAKATEAAFQLPDGIDPNMQVVPAELFNSLMLAFNEVPAKYSFRAIQAVQIAIQQKQVTNIAEYLKQLHDAKA